MAKNLQNFKILSVKITVLRTISYLGLNIQIQQDVLGIGGNITRKHNGVLHTHIGGVSFLLFHGIYFSLWTIKVNK